MSRRAIAKLLGGAALPLLLLAAGATAHAADVPGSAATTARLTFGPAARVGVFETVSDSDWYRVTLSTGTTYAFGLASPSQGPYTVTVYDTAGRRLRSSRFGFDFEDTGLEFAPPRAGTYFVEARLSADVSAGPNAGYRLSANIDCAASAATDCSLRPGRAAQRLLTWGGDVDWYRISLARGRVYDFDLDASPPGSLELAVLDSRGRVLATDDRAIEGFEAGAGGTRFVRVRNPQARSQFGSRYVVRLAQR